ncbi:hypothetical protein HYX02_00605 [Candidatus Woesearchaeota archaeon]|nr:hypothetical protein [Candidatus Woesearchaeota archaeon]
MILERMLSTVVVGAAVIVSSAIAVPPPSIITASKIPLIVDVNKPNNLSSAGYDSNYPIYPSKSVPDEGTILDEEVASKARLLAERILRIYYTNFISYEILDTYDGNKRVYTQIGSRATIKHEGVLYTIVVISKPNGDSPDWMRIRASLVGAGNTNAVRLDDVGLDGRVNSGVLPVWYLTLYGLNALYTQNQLSRQNVGEDLKLDRAAGIGLEKQGVFNKAHIRTVENLIKVLKIR